MTSPTMAQIAPNNKIEIAYVPPTTPELIPIYERLRSAKVLETLQQFLAPLILTQNLVVKFDQCGATSLRHKPKGPATICYEYVDQIERLAPTSTTVELAQGKVTRESAIVGPVVQAVLREVALATFDTLEIPVWGRRDDAADRVAAFIMLQFGPRVAWSTIVGSAWFLSGSALSPPDFADVRGLVAQRYYTTLCIALGSPSGRPDQQLFYSFSSVQAAGSLPSGRAANCRNEYETLKRAFQALIIPHIDQELLQQVQAEKMWLNYNDAK